MVAETEEGEELEEEEEEKEEEEEDEEDNDLMIRQRPLFLESKKSITDAGTILSNHIEDREIKVKGTYEIKRSRMNPRCVLTIERLKDNNRALSGGHFHYLQL